MRKDLYEVESKNLKKYQELKTPLKWKQVRLLQQYKRIKKKKLKWVQGKS